MEKMEIDGKMVGEKEPAYIIAEKIGRASCRERVWSRV